MQYNSYKISKPFDIYDDHIEFFFTTQGSVLLSHEKETLAIKRIESISILKRNDSEYVKIKITGLGGCNYDVTGEWRITEELFCMIRDLNTVAPHAISEEEVKDLKRHLSHINVEIKIYKNVWYKSFLVSIFLSFPVILILGKTVFRDYNLTFAQYIVLAGTTQFFYLVFAYVPENLLFRSPHWLRKPPLSKFIMCLKLALPWLPSRYTVKFLYGYSISIDKIDGMIIAIIIATMMAHFICNMIYGEMN